MIHSFAQPDAERCRDGVRVHGVGWENVQRVVRRKLLMIEAAVKLRDLASPPNNRLEALSGDRSGRHSIRVNDQWRVCFAWINDGAADVEVVDYIEGG